MNKRVSVRGVIRKKDKMYFIHRIKPTADYYVFAGGGVEGSEDLETALHRELQEEVNIQVKVIKELYVLNYEESTEHYFLCKHVKGEFGISDGPEYTSEDYKNRGQYIPIKIDINSLDKFNIVPEKIKELLVNDIKVDNALVNIEKVELSV